MADAVTIKFDASGLNASLDRIAAEGNSAIRPAAHAGAIVFYDEVKINVAGLGKKTGNLENSIYRAFSPEKSSESRATYHISWNYKKAPHGHLVEYGYMQTRKVYIGSDGNWYTSKTLLDRPRQVGAKPFIRPAYDAKSGAALQASKDRWTELMAQVIGDMK